MTTTGPASRLIGNPFGVDSDRVVFWFCAFAGLILSLKYYPGIESSQYYSGLILKTIHPDLFAKDPFLGGDLSITKSPYRLSIYYLLPKIFGEFWLDDRVVFPFYLLAVVFTFLGTDRIAKELGARGWAERIAICSLFLKDHQLLANKVIFAHDPDFHHSALALPISLWLLVYALRGRFVPTVLLILLLAANSLQVTPYVSGLALLMLTKTGSEKIARLSWICLAAGAVSFAIVLATVAAPPAGDRVYLWSILTHVWFHDMANPFDTLRNGVAKSIAVNAAFLAISIAAIVWPANRNAKIDVARLTIALGILLWLLAGLYVTFAPDVVKFPQILLFPFARQLQAPQILTYVLLGVAVFRWIEARPGSTRTLIGGGIFAALLMTGPGNYATWLVLLAGVSVLAIGFALACPRDSGFRALIRDPGMLAAACLAITTVTATGKGAAVNIPLWEMALRTGVYGGSAGAKWVGVDRYLRLHTPPNAVVLPVTDIPPQASEPASAGAGKVYIRRSIAARSGRAVPFPVILSRGLDRKWFEFALEQRALIFELSNEWRQLTAPEIRRRIDQLSPRVDYIVIPVRLVDARFIAELGFKQETVVNGIAVLKRSTAGHIT